MMQRPGLADVWGVLCATGLGVMLAHAKRETAVRWLRELADEIENEAPTTVN